MGSLKRRLCTLRTRKRDVNKKVFVGVRHGGVCRSPRLSLNEFPGPERSQRQENWGGGVGTDPLKGGGGKRKSNLRPDLVRVRGENFQKSKPKSWGRQKKERGKGRKGEGRPKKVGNSLLKPRGRRREGSGIARHLRESWWGRREKGEKRKTARRKKDL